MEVFECQFRDGASCTLFDGYNAPLNLYDMILCSYNVNFHEVDFTCSLSNTISIKITRAIKPPWVYNLFNLIKELLNCLAI